MNKPNYRNSLKLFSLLTIIATLILLYPSSYSTQAKSNKFKKVKNPIPNSYIVVFNDEAVQVDPNSSLSKSTKPSQKITAIAQEMAEINQAKVEHVYKSSIKGFSIKLSEEQAINLSKDPRIKYIEEDAVMHTTDTQVSPPWGLDRIDQANLPLDNTYSYDNSGTGVNVYILDTGIRPTHRELQDRIVGVYDALGGDGIDCDGHGTHVAGTIASRSYGVAKSVNIYTVRVLDCNGSGPTSSIIAGIDWVTENYVRPAVVNMSLGGGPSEAEDDAVRRSIAAGVTYVVAAGNENQDAINRSPARVSEAITVGATDKNDVAADFSNFGSGVDVFAPGVDVISTWNTSDTATNTISGTSMATPHVVGAVALYLHDHPSASPQEVEQAIVNNAVPRTSNPGPNTTTLLLNIVSNNNNNNFELITNGGFESGKEPWQFAGNAGGVSTGTPHNGESYALLGINDNVSGIMYQNLFIPSDASQANLSFWVNISTKEASSKAYDTLYVSIYDYDTKKYVETLALYTNADSNSNYEQSPVFDLSGYRNRNIALVFSVENDSSDPTRFRIDDVSLRVN